MIHILKWILKLLLLVICSLTIGLGCIILSVLLWDDYYMDLAQEVYDHIYSL